MKIILIGPRKIFPEPQAGLDFYVRDWAKFLEALGWQVKILCHPSWCPQKHHIDTLVYGLWASLKVLFMKGIVHYHGGSALFAWIPRLFGKTTAVTLHSREWLSPHTPRVLKFFYFLGEWVGVKAAHRLGCVSKRWQKELESKYHREVFYLPLPMHPQTGNSEAHLSSLGLKSKNYILYLGRLEKGKGVERLLEVFQSLNSKIPYPLAIAGASLFDDSYFQELKKLSDPNILFLGKVSGGLKQELLSHALLYLQASEAEGMSVALLEAMSHGCPCLVSDIEQNRETLGEAGFFFENKNTQDLKNRLLAALSDREVLSQMGKKAKKRIEHDFSWNRLAPSINDFYSL